MGSKNLTPLEVSENNSGRYMSLSVLIHAAMIASVALMSLPPSDFSPKNLIEFEVDSNVADIKPIPDGEKVPETRGPVAPEKTETPVKAEAPPAPAPAPKAEAPVLPKAVVTAPKADVAAKVVATAPAPKAAPAAAVTAVPETLDDIQTPDLDTSDAGEVPVAKFDENDLQEDFEKVDKNNQKALAAVKQSLEKETADAEAEGNSALLEAEEERKAEAKAMAEAQEARRAKAAAAIADAKAAEEVAAKKAADDEAAAAAAAAEKAAKANAAKDGQGRGDSGSPEPSIAVAGIPGGVRSLEQLRQMPGNKFPQYSSEERLARQEGKAVFYAYVNKDGTLSQFKLGKTTGYRNLDGKTLAALKKWKFHPGQEGWVEMPFQWTLTGDALEAGGQLRK